uniref:Putative secreted protein n=1 Tax=Haematobia irritans TaxID=7368 RepID=A0A1L8E9Y9_HAEIR
MVWWWVENLILGLHVFDQVNDTVGITEFVVVPRDQLDKLIVEGDTSLGIKDRGVGVANKIGGDNFFIGVAQDSLHGSIGSFQNLGFDGIIGGWFAQTDSQIDNRYIWCGDTESHASEFSIQSGNNFADSLGGTGGGRNDVLGSTTAITPQFARGSVNGLLGGSGGMDSGHETFNDFPVIVDNLGQGSQAVSCAGGIGHNFHVWLVGIQVDTAYKHGSISRGGRDDNLLGTALEMGRSLVDGGEDTGGLNNIFGSSAGPVDVGGVTFAENGDGLTVNYQFATFSGNGTLETTVGRIEFEQINHVFDIDEGIIDSYNVSALINGSSQDETTNATESINTDFGHI